MALPIGKCKMLCTQHFLQPGHDAMSLITPVDIAWEATSPIMRAMAQGARRRLCELRRDYPQLYRIAANTPLPAGFNGYIAANYWDPICADTPIPPNQSPFSPFAGGQCPVLYKSIVVSNGVPGGSSTDVGTDQILGPIVSATVVRLPGTNAWQYLLETVGQNGTFTDFLFVLPLEYEPTHVISFVRWDGLPDTCGNPPPTNTSTDPPPPDRRSTTIDVQGVPISLVFGPQSLNIEGSEWWRIFAEAAIPVAIDGILAYLTPQGIVWDVLTAIAGPLINTIIEGALEQIFNQVASEVDLQEVLALIRECCCREGETIQTSVLATATPGGEFSLPEKAIGCQVSIAGEIPANVPFQSGSGTAPDVYYWGWAAFSGSAAAAGTRQELHYQTHFLFAPPGAVKVTINPTRLALANVTVFYKEMIEA